MRGKKSLVVVLACAVLFVTTLGCVLPEKADAATVKMNKSSVTLYLDDDAANTVTLKILNGRQGFLEQQHQQGRKHQIHRQKSRESYCS